MLTSQTVRVGPLDRPVRHMCHNGYANCPIFMLCCKPCRCSNHGSSWPVGPAAPAAMRERRVVASAAWASSRQARTILARTCGPYLAAALFATCMQPHVLHHVALHRVDVSVYANLAVAADSLVAPSGECTAACCARFGSVMWDGHLADARNSSGYVVCGYTDRENGASRDEFICANRGDKSHADLNTACVILKRGVCAADRSKGQAVLRHRSTPRNRPTQWSA